MTARPLVAPDNSSLQAVRRSPVASALTPQSRSGSQVAVTATPLFGTEQCAKGPGVWCENIRTAKQCSAVTHCQQAVWNKPVVNTFPCDLCKELISVVGNLLKDNVTQGEIMAMLTKGCCALPDPLVSECKELIAEYYPLIINLVEEELSDPSVVCCAFGLCKSLQQYLASLKPAQLTTNEIPDVDLSKMVSPFLANVPILMKPAEKTDKTAEKGVCQDCLQLISDLQDALKSNSSFSKMLIENFLKDCDQLGVEFSEVCKTYVNQYGDLVIQMAIQMTANEMCCYFGMCPRKVASPLQDLVPAKVMVPAMKLQPAIKVADPKTSKKSLPICDLCELIVQHVEKFLDTNKTREHIKEGLDKVCDALPSQYGSTCRSFVEEYIDLIITFLEAKEGPEIICRTLGCCRETEPQIVKLDSINTKSENCDLCKMVMMYLDSILAQNATQEKIERALHMICNYVPKKMSNECCSLVAEYGPMLIEILLKQMDPGTVCGEINLCPGVRMPLLGAEKCMWGPSYWCKDLETAGRCNAIEHCKRHVWN